MSATVIKLHREGQLTEHRTNRQPTVGARLHRLWQGLRAGGRTDAGLFAGQDAVLALHLATLRHRDTFDRR